MSPDRRERLGLTVAYASAATALLVLVLVHPGARIAVATSWKAAAALLVAVVFVPAANHFVTHVLRSNA